jgi:hypothetical protein
VSAPGGYRTLRDLVTSGTRAPVQTRPATATERGPVSMPLAAPRVPVVLDVDPDDAPTSSGDMSPSGRIALCVINLDPIAASFLARIVEAYTNDLGTDDRVLLGARVQRLRVPMADPLTAGRVPVPENAAEARAALCRCWADL